MDTAMDAGGVAPDERAVHSLLVLGGARSGKSGYAQAQAEASGLAPIFIATAEPGDDEMRERIARHAAARGSPWTTREVPYELAGALAALATSNTIVLVDCLTLWLSNLMLRGEDVEAAVAALAGVVPTLTGPVIFVSNEVGAGIVPETRLGRRFRDVQGRLNQAMAAACEAVVLVTAGLSRQIKPAPRPAFRFAW